MWTVMAEVDKYASNSAGQFNIPLNNIDKQSSRNVIRKRTLNYRFKKEIHKT